MDDGDGRGIPQLLLELHIKYRKPRLPRPRPPPSLFVFVCLPLYGLSIPTAYPSHRVPSTPLPFSLLLGLRSEDTEITDETDRPTATDA